MLTIETCETMQRKIEERMIALFPEDMKDSQATQNLIRVAVAAAVAAIQEYDNIQTLKKHD